MYTPRGHARAGSASSRTSRLASAATSPAWPGANPCRSGGVGTPSARSCSTSRSTRNGSGWAWTR